MPGFFLFINLCLVFPLNQSEALKQSQQNISYNALSKQGLVLFTKLMHLSAMTGRNSIYFLFVEKIQFKLVIYQL